MRNLLPHMLILFAAKHGLNLAPDFLEKLGFKELPLDLVGNIEAQTFPNKRYYDLVIIFWFILYLSSSILTIFLSVSVFANFQRNLLGGGSIYFASDSGWIFGLVNFFGTLLLLLLLSIFVLAIFMPKGFKNFILSEQLSIDYPLDFRSSFKIVLIATLLYYLLITPFTFLAFRNYQAVFKDRVIGNHFFDFSTKKYSFEEVYSVTFSSQVSAQDEATISVMFLFVDGRKIDFFKKPPLISDYHRIKNLYHELNLRKVTIEIIKPTDEVLSVVSRTCPQDQIEFYSLFGVDQPISPRPACK